MATRPDAVTTWWRRISLRAKVTGVTVSVLALGLIGAGIGTVPILRNALIDNVDAQLPALSTSDQAGRFFSITSDGDGGVTFRLQDVDMTPDYFIGIYDSDGTFRISAGGAPDAPRPDFPASFTLADAHDAIESGAPLLLTGDDGTQFHGSVIVNEAWGSFYTQFIVLSLDEVDKIVGTYFGVFITIALITILVAALLTRGLVTLTFRRLGHVESTAMAITAGDFSQRLTDLEPTTEVGRLNSALNAMLDRLDEAIAQRDRSVRHMRRFIGDASHELRTPLVSVRGYAELYRMGAIRGDDDTARAMERIEKEAVRMGVLVEDLLALARLDEQRPVTIEPLDLRPLAADAAMDVRAAAPDREILVVDTTAVSGAPEPTTTPNASETGPAPSAPTKGRTSGRRRLLSKKAAAAASSAPATSPRTSTGAVPIVFGEENKVRQVIANLLGNARRFAPEGTPIEIVIGADRAREMGWVSIVDHGEGIPPQIRDQIFQRFWRADNSRARETGGSGLGLAIVASIVQALHGSVDVTETPGGGATFTVSLPLASGRALPEQFLPDTQPIQSLDL